MHSYSVFLALEVALERSREAERLSWYRRAGGINESRLGTFARRIRGAIFGRSMDLPPAGRLPAGQTQH